MIVTYPVLIVEDPEGIRIPEPTDINNVEVYKNV